MKNKEQFEELAIEIGFDIYEENGEYFYAETRMAYELFQATKSQATPEGFVLVPKEPTLKMSVAYEENAVAPCSSLSVSGYKAMIEAQEQSHDNSN